MAFSMNLLNAINHEKLSTKNLKDRSTKSKTKQEIYIKMLYFRNKKNNSTKLLFKTPEI